jgi:hypothetical protein
MHGERGEDGSLAGVLSMNKIPLASPDILASSVCIDKRFTKIFLKGVGVRCLPSVYAEKEEDLLFTGDAIGSGCGVWMQVPGGLTVAHYAESLRFFLRWLVERGGRMRFFGGHNRQPWQSKKVPDWNPLSLGLLADMIDLAEGVANGTIVGEPCDAKSFTDQPALYAAFGRAEMIFDSERIK